MYTIRNQHARLSIDSNHKPSTICDHREKRSSIHLKSPRTISKGRTLASPSKIMIRKITSGQLFREAHKTNGETYLKDPPQSEMLRPKHSNLESPMPKAGQKYKLPLSPTTINSESKLQINKVMNINIGSRVEEEGDLTKIINKGIPIQENDSFEDISRVMSPEEAADLQKSLELKKGNTIQQLLHYMNK